MVFMKVECIYPSYSWWRVCRYLYTFISAPPTVWWYGDVLELRNSCIRQHQLDGDHPCGLSLLGALRDLLCQPLFLPCSPLFLGLWLITPVSYFPIQLVLARQPDAASTFYTHSWCQLVSSYSNVVWVTGLCLVNWCWSVVCLDYSGWKQRQYKEDTLRLLSASSCYPGAVPCVVASLTIFEPRAVPQALFSITLAVQYHWKSRKILTKSSWSKA